ncbi:MAG TPA: SRPBCC family protein [Acidobacteriaceae bacterium]|nr:SRPBCC family protein [Acidobacteriaceae bacterium]
MELSVVHSTFVIEQSYPYSVERLFAAFADPAKKRRWFAESSNHDVELYEMDFRVGGVERTSYRFREGTPFPGTMLETEGAIQDIVPNQRVVTTSTMSLGDRRISSSLVTVEFVPKEQGTELVLTYQGAFYEGSGGPKMREEGWRKLLGHLGAELAK